MAAQKITFGQAAKLLGVHLNTLKNWQKAGKLPSAEKLSVNGIATWYVDFAEAERVFTLTRPISSRQDDQTGYTEPPPGEPPGPPNTAQTLATQQAQFMLEVQRPLLEKIDRLENRIEDLARENGELLERNRTLEALLTAQNGSDGSERLTSYQDVPQTPESPTEPPGQDRPAKRRRWWQF